MKINTPCGWILTMGMTALMALPTLGQDNARNNQRDQREPEQQRDQRDRRDQEQTRDQRDRRQQEGQRRRGQAQLSLDGWVKVAADYDGDGRYEAVETIYVYDLERARKSSEARARDMQRRQQDHRQRDMQRQTARRPDMRDQQQRRPRRSGPQMLQASGEIVKLQRKDLMNSDKTKVVATLKTDQGRKATVCLGSEEKLSKLDLQKGDRVQVRGVRARIDGQPVLLAQQVSSNGQTVSDRLMERSKLKRLKGEVVSTRETSFRGRDGKFTVAKVRLEGEEGTKQVNLGPSAELEDLEIREGKEIQLLGRQGRINDQQSWIAQVVRVDGQSVDIRESTKRTLRKQRDKDDAKYEKDRDDKDGKDRKDRSKRNER